METTTKILNKLWHKLWPLRHLEPGKYQAFTGFDGFVDRIQKVVKKADGSSTEYFERIGQFAAQIQSLTGDGGKLETATVRKKIGGNAPVLSNTLGNLGVQIFCIGAMGYPKVHPVFLKMHKLCELISVGKPGENLVLEFSDAKLVFSEQGVFDQYDWEYIKGHTEFFDQLKDIVASSQLFALVDWANLPHASGIWRGFLEDLIKPAGITQARFFFHLGDPYKLSRKRIGETIGLINDFEDFGKVTVGLNDSEAIRLWLVLNGHEASADIDRVKVPPLDEVARFVFRVFDISALVLRTPDRTWVATEEEVLEIQGRKVYNPKILMGSGDNFDAGYCLGLLEGMDANECALLGTAAAGAYMQNGYSPCTEDLIEYIKTWADQSTAAASDHHKTKSNEKVPDR